MTSGQFIAEKNHSDRLIKEGKIAELNYSDFLKIYRLVGRFSTGTCLV